MATLKVLFVLMFLVGGLLILTVGCRPAGRDPSGDVVKDHSRNRLDDPDSLVPPEFSLGDVVGIEESLKVGIVIDCARKRVEYKDRWVYSVLFQNNTIKYSEDQLFLVEAFDWNQPSKEGIID